MGCWLAPQLVSDRSILAVGSLRLFRPRVLQMMLVDSMAVLETRLDELSKQVQDNDKE